jgi:hypothetical protein
VHSLTLFTNVIKNLGIGLYPMQATVEGRGSCHWEYGMPHAATPGIKGSIPHQVWITEMDLKTGVPRRDAKGHYIVRKTGGILATMVDIVKAVSDQGIYMFHVVDAIEAINIDHMAVVPGTKEPEGLAFAGVDPVATDSLCARYMFKNVPLEEALKSVADGELQGTFLQRVDVPVVDETQIVTRPGYDSPLARDVTSAYAEQRGLGAQPYYVVGQDVVAECPLVSLQGHMGRWVEGRFTELLTDTLYFAALKMPWDLQRTAFAYLECSDRLTHSSVKEAFLNEYDEDGDGVVTYEEFGKNGTHAPVLFLAGSSNSIAGTEELGYLRGPFSSTAMRLKWADATWNPDRHDIFEKQLIAATCMVAYRMSQSDAESEDPFFPSLTWGRGKWPSYQFASYVRLTTALYGPEFDTRVGFPSLYGHAFRYADLTQNDGKYSGRSPANPTPDAVEQYAAALAHDRARPLDFTLFVPPNYGALAGSPVLNVEETEDPARILTVQFRGGREVWPDLTVRV